ncbi:NAD(P)H-dependent oxidoreductase [Phocaeicola dorei]|nr:flavodoxin [Phocaeicola dorei]MCS3159266.1 NAD(P)H-dependent oxidoreductase [Phocaeicola dorei]
MPTPTPDPDPTAGKTLIVYYSFTNNVHTIVSDLQTQIEADVVRVEPAEEGLDYAANNYAIGSALIQAIRNNPNDAASYPEIKPVEVNIADYDRIIVGAPLWWSNMAAPLQTFLFQYGSQMEGKSIGLIVSSSSSGINGVESDARRLIPGGDFLEPSLWIRSGQTSNCHSMIADWLSQIN